MTVESYVIGKSVEDKKFEEQYSKFYTALKNAVQMSIDDKDIKSIKDAVKDLIDFSDNMFETINRLQ